jgi:hypothetical protein
MREVYREVDSDGHRCSYYIEIASAAESLTKVRVGVGNSKLSRLPK